MTRYHDKPFVERLLFWCIWGSGIIVGILSIAVLVKQVFL